MSKKSYVMFLGALIALASVNVGIRADSVPWGYSVGSTEIFNNNTPLQTSSIQITGASGVATGSSGIIIANMMATSSVGAASPDSFANVPFNLTMTLTDVNATGSKSAGAVSSGVVHVSGMFSASNVTKNSLLPGASPWSSPVLAQLVLGADDVGWHTYSILLSSFTSPGQPGGSPGSIQAIVRIGPADSPPVGPIGSSEPPPPSNPGENAPSAAPEPATLVMASFGILPILVLWRKRRGNIEI